MSDDDKIRDVFLNPPAKTDDGPEAVRPRVHFPEISCRAWEHPADRAALTAMRKVPGFDLLLRRMSGIISERALRLHYLGNSVRVGETQFSRLHGIWLETCKQFDADRVPQLFVGATRGLNAGAIGWDDPFVALNSGALELLDDEELRFVMAHELGHVLSGHSLYRTMMIFILRFVLPRLMFLPAAWMMVQGVVLALMEWNRKGELSCDRAGLLAVQDLGIAQRVHMKMAGGSHLDQMSVAAFQDQAAEYENAGDLRDNVLKMLMLTSATHPFPVLRLAELTRWAEGGEYQRILDGHYPRRAEDDHATVREDIARTADAYKQRWSEREDALGRLVQDLGGLVTGRSEGSLWDSVKGIFRNQGFGWAAEADDEPEAEADVDAGQGDDADDADGADGESPDDTPTPNGKTL